ncbi:MAG: hypothetical protein ACR5LF_01870 [Symbiopectobacterium sp.]
MDTVITDYETCKWQVKFYETCKWQVKLSTSKLCEHQITLLARALTTEK